MSYITTYTGLHIDPAAPEAELLDIRDIAHALSMTCRGNGHVSSFFSVGQHCLHCAAEARARGYDRRVVLACLLHDASEAYMSDVPRPFKKMLPEYIAAEERLLDMVYETFLGSKLTPEEAALVKAVDDDMLVYDLKNLLAEEPEGELPQMYSAFSYRVLPFEEVERRYLEMYERLTQKGMLW